MYAGSVEQLILCNIKNLNYCKKVSVRVLENQKYMIMVGNTSGPRPGTGEVPKRYLITHFYFYNPKSVLYDVVIN